MIKHYVWADSIADTLIKRGKRHVLHGMWTPSGYFHIGNARNELMMPGLVHHALRDRGIKSRHNFLIDDFDDFDKVPSGFDKAKFEEHLGKPLREVPSPGKGNSWASFFSEEITSVLEKFGLEPNIISVYDEYMKGTYDKAIKIVLDNAKAVRDIWVRITKSEKPDDWLPIIIKCENCGRTATTLATAWDGKVLKYSCNNDRDYAKSCGNEGEIKPEKGRVKLPWRIHWAAGWFIFGTTFESAGKDHFTKGGSVDTGHAFMREIFRKEPPLQVPTEYVQLGGAKISGSVGNVITLSQWLSVAESELLRFLMLSYQPNTAIEFDFAGKFLMLNERYEESERAYFGEKIISDKRTAQLKRQYELSQVNKEKKHILSFSNAIMFCQLHPNATADKIAEIMKDAGKKITSEDKKLLKARLIHARNWVDKYAPDEMKITLKEKSDVKLNDREKAAVSSLIKEIKKSKNEKHLQNRIYEIAKENDIDPKKFFQLLYQILIGRDEGPRLGPFIIAIGKEKVISLLNG